MAAASGSAAAWRLRAARVCAWALLLSGWLTLGELGAAAWPQTAGGVLPMALWLLAIGAGLALARRQPPGAVWLRAGLLGTGTLACALLTVGPPGRAGLAGLALAWAALLVLASLAVRALRRGAPGRLTGAPILPACAGAVLAWATLVAGQSAWLLLPCALLLAALVPARVSQPGACRAGLFDCSLPLVGHGPQGWRWPAPRHWPGQAAALVMLPMMASLPAMAPWCAAGASGAGGVVGTAVGPGHVLAGLHLAAMLLPALILVAASARRPEHVPGQARQAVGVAMLMLAGVCLWGAWPQPSTGLLLLGLCQGAAWSLAWAGPLLRHGRTPGMPDGLGDADRSPPRRPAAAVAAPRGTFRPPCAALGLLLAPALVLGLGSAIAQWGAAAVLGVHLALAVWALLGWWLDVVGLALPVARGTGTAAAWRADLP
ncbi:MAG: hypothetical protein RLZZ584_3499 [Pseudomonadota bacterium]